MAEGTPVLDAIDERLRMLDARADGERLGLEGDTAVVQTLVETARRVADRQHDGVAHELAAGGATYADHPTLVHQQIDDTVGPDIDGAARLEVGALGHEDLRQPVGSDVRPRLYKDLGIGSVRDEGAQDGSHRALVFGARVELAVG